jgi:hypothetical protein
MVSLLSTLPSALKTAWRMVKLVPSSDTLIEPLVLSNFVGRWEFPMGQIYTFKRDGTFSAPYVSGTWKSAGMNQANASALYDLYTYSKSGRLSQKPEVLTLSRGDREGHEYESGHVLRLDQQMRVKKLPDRADDDFSGNAETKSTETRRSHSSSEEVLRGHIGGSEAVLSQN